MKFKIKFDKETQHYWVYKAGDGPMSILGTLYIPKSEIKPDGYHPDELQVEISAIIPDARSEEKGVHFFDDDVPF